VAKHAVPELARINQAPDILLARLACVSFVNAQAEPRGTEPETEPDTKNRSRNPTEPATGPPPYYTIYI